MITTSLFSALHDQLTSLDRHVQLTRSFSAATELLVNTSGNVAYALSR